MVEALQMEKTIEAPPLTESQAFAQRAMARLKSGETKRDILPNEGVPFSRERDAKAVADFKEFINSPLWAAIAEELQ